MTLDLQTLLDAVLAEMSIGLVIFLRVGAAVALLPAFGDRSVPVRVRLGLALAFTAIVAPIIQVSADPLDPVRFVSLLGTETLTGLVFGLSIRLIVMSLQIAGAIAAQSTSLAQIFGSAAADPMPAIGHVLTWAGLALAAMAGLHVHIAEALVRSYESVPVGMLLDPADLAEFSVARVGQCFSLAVSLAAPFLLASFVYNFALGAINRAMPQLMVVLIGAPVITGTSLAFLAVFSPFLLGVWLDSLDMLLNKPFGSP